MQRSRRRQPGARARSACGAIAAAVLVVWLVPVATASDRAAPQAGLLSKQAIPVLYNQGIARVRGGWILSGTLSPIPDTDALVRTDEHFNVLVTNKPAIPPEWRARGYDHIGDIDVVGNVVYVPFEQPDYTKGQQVTARYDARTLRFLAAVVVPQHENSFVAVDPATRIAWSMDHFDGNELLRYDVARSWKRLPPLRLSTVLHHTQGAGVTAGAIWISTSDPRNDLYRVSMKTGHVDRIAQIVDPLGEGEGIDATPLPSGGLHAMVLDPDLTKVWVEHFSRPSAPR